MADAPKRPTRRQILAHGVRGGAIAGLVGLGGLLVRSARASGGRKTLWQIDPRRCTACGNCATYCVLKPSAVKCVHNFAICGYCLVCFGYFHSKPREYTTGAENQACPTDAIRRRWVEDEYFEYTIDEARCVGCAKCVKGCTLRANGSLFLQVRHDRCVNCNVCAIALACPANAFVRVPADRPYIIKEGLA
jgi:electron transport complex protein RnfB